MEIYFLTMGEENLLCINVVGVKRSTTDFICASKGDEKGNVMKKKHLFYSSLPFPE